MSLRTLTQAVPLPVATNWKKVLQLQTAFMSSKIYDWKNSEIGHENLANAIIFKNEEVEFKVWTKVCYINYTFLIYSIENSVKVRL